mgnify:CR=1 FL=1
MMHVAAARPPKKAGENSRSLHLNLEMRSNYRNYAHFEDYPGIVGFTDDPIVSSDVIGSSLSLLFDTKGTVKAGTQTIKTLSWYENIGHAARLLDVVRLYSTLESKGEVA